jgi:uncharacterized DUF497 family protein
VDFERDNEKAASNSSKHGIQFSEAATTFGDPLSVTFPDPDHSDDEERFITIGLSDRNRVLIISHTDRSGSYQRSQSNPARKEDL